MKLQGGRVSKKGDKLEKGIEVYLLECYRKDSRGRAHYLIQKKLIGQKRRNKYTLDLEYYTFIYDPLDGLWATDGVRKAWIKKPFLHPRFTLFDAIYRELQQ
jgi:hypothetical protein